VEKETIDATLQEIRVALEGNELERALTALLRLRPADRADAFADLDDEDQVALLPRLDLETAADLLEELDDDEAAEVARSLTPARLADVLDEMEPDEAADILGDLPPDQAARTLAEMEERDDVLPLLGHPDETAGGLMTTAFIALRPRTSAAQAIDFLRQLEPDQKTPYYLYVVDRDQRLTGVVGLRDLVIADPQAPVETFMNPDVIYVAAGTDQEQVARTMGHYGLGALPVVDDALRLLGVITQDEVFDVLEEETTEDVLQMGGIDARTIVDKPYWSQRILEVARSRFVWLIGLFIAQTLTGTVLQHFSRQLEAVVALSFFIPLLIGTGGNAGSQSVTSVIRALAVGDVHRRDAVRVLLREVQTGLLLGSPLGLVAYGRVLLWGLSQEMALVVGLTVLVICVWANAVGCLVPFIAHALRIDPTVMSAPLITTVVDATGLVIYLSIATTVIQEL
jgi:magnesium transporter